MGVGGGGCGAVGGQREGGGVSCIKNSWNIWLFPEEFYNSNGTQNRHEYLHITSELVFMGGSFFGGGGGGGGRGAFFLVPQQ